MFDLAHELGHIILHPWSENIELIDKNEFKLIEKQENMFASAFLLPADSFGSDIKRYHTNLNYYVELKKKWGVSIQSMIYRTHQLGIITNNQYKYLMTQVSSKGWRKKEPNDKTFILEENLFQVAIDVLISEKVFKPKSFMLELEEIGLCFNTLELETLLNLQCGTLSNNDENNSNIIRLKN